MTAPLPWAAEPASSAPYAARVYSVPLREQNEVDDEVAVCLDLADAELIARTANSSIDADKRLRAHLVDHFPHGYVCGERCPIVLNSPDGWARHVVVTFLEGSDA